MNQTPVAMRSTKLIKSDHHYISLLNKCHIIIYKNGTNNDDNSKNSGNDNGNASNNNSNCFIEISVIMHIKTR